MKGTLPNDTKFATKSLWKNSQRLGIVAMGDISH